jgi:release factor glutamine methyltransferase
MTTMTARLPTPSTSHLSFSTIYEPAEDSFLFLDTLSSQAQTTFLGNHLKSTPSPLIVEVGTGSGVILAFLTAHAKQIFGRNDVLTLGVDVNLDACKGGADTVRTAVEDASSDEGASSVGRYLGNVQGDLTTALRPGSVDVLVFNPPYVPTEDLPVMGSMEYKDRFSEESHLLALSYAGGVDGMEVTERLLQQLPDVLSERGVAYVLFCASNKTEEALTRIMKEDRWQQRERWKWARDVVGKTGGKGGWERLEIVRIRKRYDDDDPP